MGLHKLLLYDRRNIVSARKLDFIIISTHSITIAAKIYHIAITHNHFTTARGTCSICEHQGWDYCCGKNSNCLGNSQFHSRNRTFIRLDQNGKYNHFVVNLNKVIKQLCVYKND